MNDRIIQRFNSLSEFVDYADSSSHPKFKESRSRERCDWAGSKSWEEAVELSKGWTEGAEKFERMKAKISNTGNSSRKVTRMREVGPGGLNMGRYIMDHPQPFATRNDTNALKGTKGKIVRLYVNISANALIKPDHIERRGAAILSLVDALQRSGRRVEIVAVQAVMNGYAKGYECHVKIKRPHERTNLPTVAFALAHPSMLRRIVFGAEEALGDPLFDEHVGGWGYGNPSEMLDPPKGAIYLSQIDGFNWGQDSYARRWVEDQCKAQGVTLKS